MRPFVLTQELVRIQDLSLAAKLVSEEVLLGLHLSKRTGAGTEFEQYRHYQAGDDPKRIDWRLYARSDRHQIRESATESSLRLRFLLDLTGSMRYHEEEISRLQYAQLLIASLAYVGFRQGDEMSLYGLTTRGVEQLVGPSRQSLHRILFALEKAEAGGTWPSLERFQPQMLLSQEREVVVLVSDLLQTNDEWTALLPKLAGPRRELWVFQVLGRQEADFTLDGFYRFKDLESGQELELHTARYQQAVRERAAAHQEQLRNALTHPQVYFYTTLLHEPLVPVLRKALLRK